MNDQCPECGSDRLVVTDDRVNYQIHHQCPDCGYDETDNYEDIYGCMSVPWGHLT